MTVAMQPMRTPLYQRCHAHLRARIERGDFSIDEPLPTEEQLCRDYRVSRITVRRAVSELIRQGLVSRRQGSGTYITRPQRLGKSLSLVGTLDSVMSSAQGVTHALLGRCRTLLPATLARTFGVARGRVERIDVLYARGAPFAHTAIFMRTPVAQALGDDVIGERGASVFHLIEECSASAVAHADQRIDPVAAPAMIAIALGIGHGRAILRAQRGYFSRDGSLLHSALIHYHPARFDIAMRFIP